MLSVLATQQPHAGWVFNWGPLFILLPITYAYLVRWWKVRAHPFRLVLFVLGMSAAVIALFSPVDPLGEQLLTMHMVQHLLLLDIAPILILLALTKAIFRPATKRVIQLEKSVPWLMAPAFGAFLYIGGMWFWHMPTMYDAAVRHSGVHVMEHLTFTIAGGVYWWHLISPVRDQRRLSGMGAVMYMATTKLFVGILGLSLTFVPFALYKVYVEQHQPWGFSALEDQSMAGVIMATEQSIVMGIALVWLVAQAIERSNKADLRRERFEDRKKAEQAAAEAARVAAGGVPATRELY